MMIHCIETIIAKKKNLKTWGSNSTIHGFEALTLALHSSL